MNCVKISKNMCKGCNLCIQVCKSKLIIMSEDLNVKGLHFVFFSDKDAKCTGCGLCAMICPDAAIEVEKEGSAYAKKK